MTQCRCRIYIILHVCSFQLGAVFRREAAHLLSVLRFSGFDRSNPDRSRLLRWLSVSQKIQKSDSQEGRSDAIGESSNPESMAVGTLIQADFHLFEHSSTDLFSGDSFANNRWHLWNDANSLIYGYCQQPYEIQNGNCADAGQYGLEDNSRQKYDSQEEKSQKRSDYRCDHQYFGSFVLPQNLPVLLQ